VSDGGADDGRALRFLLIRGLGTIDCYCKNLGMINLAPISLKDCRKIFIIRYIGMIFFRKNYRNSLD